MRLAIKSPALALMSENDMPATVIPPELSSFCPAANSLEPLVHKCRNMPATNEL